MSTITLLQKTYPRHASNLVIPSDIILPDGEQLGASLLSPAPNRYVITKRKRGILTLRHREDLCKRVQRSKYDMESRMAKLEASVFELEASVSTLSKEMADNRRLLVGYETAHRLVCSEHFNLQIACSVSNQVLSKGLNRTFTGHTYVNDLLANAERETSQQIYLPRLILDHAMKMPSFKDIFLSPINEDKAWLQSADISHSILSCAGKIYDYLDTTCQADLYLLICSYIIQKRLASGLHTLQHPTPTYIEAWDTIDGAVGPFMMWMVGDSLREQLDLSE